MGMFCSGTVYNFVSVNLNFVIRMSKKYEKIIIPYIQRKICKKFFTSKIFPFILIPILLAYKFFTRLRIAFQSVHRFFSLSLGNAVPHSYTPVSDAYNSAGCWFPPPIRPSKLYLHIWHSSISLLLCISTPSVWSLPFSFFSSLNIPSRVLSLPPFLTFPILLLNSDSWNSFKQIETNIYTLIDTFITIKENTTVCDYLPVLHGGGDF